MVGQLATWGKTCIALAGSTVMTASLKIDEELLREAMETTGLNKSEVLEEGLRALLPLKA